MFCNYIWFVCVCVCVFYQFVATFTRDLTTAHKITDHTTSTEKGVQSPSVASVLLPPLNLPMQEQQELGYMSLRDEFDRVRFICGAKQRVQKNWSPAAYCGARMHVRHFMLTALR